MPIDQIPEDVIQAEHVRTTFRQFPVAIVVHIMDAAVVAGMLWFLAKTRHAALAYWFGAMLAVSFLRILVMRRYIADTAKAVAWRRWSIVAAAFSGTFGILWAMAIALFLNIDDPVTVIVR